MPFLYFSFMKIIRTFWNKCEKMDKERIDGLAIPEECIQKEFNYEGDGNIDHTLYVTLPKGKDPSTLPVYIHVHGGGWFYGNKEIYVPFAKFLASLGIAVVTMNYSLAPKKKVIDMTREVLDAISYVQENSKELSLSLDHVYLGGDSAGGQLASIVLASSSRKDLQQLLGKKLSLPLDGLVLNHPVCYVRELGKAIELKNPVGKMASKNYLAVLYGWKYKKDPFCTMTSDFDNLIQGVPFPKTLVITSLGDTFYRPLSEKVFVRLLEEKTDTKIICNKEEPNGHVYNISYINDRSAIDTNKEIAVFLKNC